MGENDMKVTLSLSRDDFGWYRASWFQAAKERWFKLCMDGVRKLFWPQTTVEDFAASSSHQFNLVVTDVKPKKRGFRHLFLRRSSSGLRYFVFWKGGPREGVPILIGASDEVSAMGFLSRDDVLSIWVKTYDV